MARAILREATVSDARDMLEVNYGALKRNGTCMRYSVEDFEEMKQIIASEDHKTIVAIDPQNKEIILAFGICKVNEDNIEVVKLMAIENKCRAGTQIISQVKTMGFILGKEKIITDASPKGEGFYEKQEFVRDKDVVTGGGRRYAYTLNS